MSEFVLVVVLANLIILACMYLLRHVIAIRAPVLIIAVGISIFLCILYPFLAARAGYPLVIYLYAALVLAGAGVLYKIESALFAVNDTRGGETPGMAIGEALAAVEGGPVLDVGRGAFRGFSATEVDILKDFPETAGEADEQPDGVGGRFRYAHTGAGGKGLEEIPETGDLIISTDLLEIPPAKAAAAIEPVWEAKTEEKLDEIYADDAVEQDLRSLVAYAFDKLVAGNRTGAAEIFFKALKQNPPPKLAAKLCIEIGSIYMAEGRTGQALGVLEMLQDLWGPVLDENDLGRIKTIIIQLRREVQ